MDPSRTEKLPEGPPGRVAATSAKYIASPLTRDGLASATQVLALAFRDNPLNTAVIQAGSKKRYRSNLAGMRALLHASLGHALMLEVREAGSDGRGGPSGVLIGTEPYGYPLPGPTFAGHLRCLFGQGLRAMGRWAQVYRVLEAAHPLEPHWYLAVLGIEPEHQRKGSGAALLHAFLETVDAAGDPSYLETDRQENIAFYARAGYEVVREVPVLEVPVWCMWRPAR